MQVLALPERARAVLSLLIRIDTDRSVSESARQQDEQGRQGVLSWARLIALVEPEEQDDLEAAAVLLAEWGLIQVVGSRASDPILPGSAPMRLTFAGRICLGLGPAPRPAPPPLPPEARPWQVWHAVSREGLLMAARERLGPSALRAISLPRDLRDEGEVIGALVIALCTTGLVVLDGFALEKAPGAAALERLLWRTRHARGARVLLLPSPELARVAVLASGGELRWIEAEMHGRRETGRFDRSLTRHLQGDAPDLAHVCGVPDNELAMPRRVSTHWEELMLPDHVRHQFDQVLVHARFRLHELPRRGVLPTSDKGYRLMLSGLPGTGKSMAAEALAHTLDRMIVKIDLSSVLSKWLGETEKLLSQIFEVAEMTGSVLVLDEAESLFRQRDSGPGGRDGMGTVVAYLLARLDRFDGVLVATTNRTQDLDEAFFRRFDDFVVLPIPGDATRSRLWERMIRSALDPATAEDALDVDFTLIGQRFAIAGGLIHKAAVRAAAWAYGLDRPMSTSIVLASLARELEKNDRSPNLVFIEPYRAEVEALLGTTRHGHR